MPCGNGGSSGSSAPRATPEETLRRSDEARRSWAAAPAGPYKKRGVGIGAMWYGIGNTVIANPSTMRVGLRRSGRLTLYNGAVDIGQGTYTVLPQIVADAVGVPLSLVDQVRADTDLTEDAGKSSASRWAVQRQRAEPRHFGQWRLRQLL